jgi:branched-chain amino acid transport system substrate-binding protein
VATLGVAACGGSSSGSGGSSPSGASGSKTLIISTDLPLQGSSADSSADTNKAIQLYLDSVGNKAGKYSVKLKTYDDSTAQAGQWVDSACTKNAQEHVATRDEVAVMGTFNSGCAKLEVPVLNQAPGGQMLMVSHANTNVGLTKTWDAGEPAKYAPSGTKSYARVVTTDDYQGTADATFAANDLKIKKVYILNDNQTYGQGVAKTFAAAATKLGMTVVANDPWDKAQPNYTSVMQKIKAANVDMIFLAGIEDNNGAQLVKDKVAVLGDNTKVKLMAPDGFTGYPQLNKLPQSQGMYLSFAGLSIQPLRAAGGAGAKFLDSYKAKYGTDPSSSYALYGVAAVQVILDAIAKSDGTRQSVTDAVFKGGGIDIPAATSVLGKELKIDPATGDVNAKDISIEVIKNNAETYVKAQPVT